MAILTHYARNLRKNMTDAENKIWFQIRNRRFENLKFKRQFPIPPYIVDFICEELKIIIEIDGGQHNYNANDVIRDKFLTDKGYKVIRFWNNDVLTNIEGVMQELSHNTKTSMVTSIPHPNPLPRGEGAEKKHPDNKILIGEIRGAHGVRGLVRIAVFAQDTNLFKKLKNPSITLKNKHKNEVWLADMEGVTSKEQADALKSTKIYCDRNDLENPADDEVYFNDLIGMDCVTEDGDAIGIVEAVENFGAGDLLDIKPPKGQNFYLSFAKDTVIEIKDKVTIRLPEVL